MKSISRVIIALVFLSFLFSFDFIRKPNWGFFAHQKINRLAVFRLPPEMISFYKHHIQYVTENAVNPDRRRYAVDYEAPRHYIDLDVYGDSAVYKMPRYWNDAIEKYTEDTLQAYGIVPWHVHFVTYQLTEAFKENNAEDILRYSADLGHYIADANVPLHTTENYNGQLTGQYGIHGFWESRLPELYSEDYNFFIGKAEYVDNTQIAIWDAVKEAHFALDSVFGFEKTLTKEMSADSKYSSELRGSVNTKVYSRNFSKAYHKMLSGQVERRMRNSVKMVGDYWYTAWVNAGQPNLDLLIEERAIFSEEEYIPQSSNEKLRQHESGVQD
ncbi:zinc dependent phospholipase C family protein [Marivirga salinae]|uniref:Zinc dependent phospholipase C family protein n=1 Tax=Marivirga salinarum TaxID=3059078 RepID=A0AA49GBZ9_9BACT|nr:zinc dependent phospholipase C family protein [Marivirga sp. BDSF4-3]WKK78664.2 zinc dependent phospholipase C family protein [Marivirga sp. BDSF4-3]